MADILTCELKTLTPLWTGGADGTSDRLHATGIIGSLRWWYEAVVRGLGGSACDPSEHTCPDNDGNYCDVCAVFGATGLQRAFRVIEPVWQNNAVESRLTIKVNNNRGWYLGRGFLDEGTLKFLPLRLSGGFRRDDLVQTLLLISQIVTSWGGIGPKTQQGYGVARLQPQNASLDVGRAIEAFGRIKDRSKRKVIDSNNEWPSLEKFFFVKVRFSENNPEQWIRARTSSIIDGELQWYLNGSNRTQEMRVLPLAPVVRYHLRGLIRDYIHYNGHTNAPARWRLMGVVVAHWHNSDYGKIEKQQRNQWQCQVCGQTWIGKDMERAIKENKDVIPVERQASLIHVSHAYPVNGDEWEFRIWGWLPDELPGNVSRNRVLQHLRQWLGVQQQRQWHRAANGALWTSDRVNVKAPIVLWFEKHPDENSTAYLRDLLAEHVQEKGAIQ